MTAELQKVRQAKTHAEYSEKLKEEETKDRRALDGWLPEANEKVNAAEDAVQDHEEMEVKSRELKNSEFVIRHFAGPVHYCEDAFLVKNEVARPRRLKMEEGLRSMLDLPGLTGRMLFWRCDERAPGASAPVPGKVPSWWFWLNFALEGDEEDAEEAEKDS